MPDTLTINDLQTIRDVVPNLDLSAIRALRRVGFDVVRHHRALAPSPTLSLVAPAELLE